MKIKDKKVLAIDLGLKCALFDGVTIYDLKTDKSKTRWKDFYEGLSDIIETFQPEVIVVEDAMFQQASAAAVFLGQKAIVETYCQRSGILFFGIWVGTVKKTFTGNGKAQKEDMIQTCIELGYSPSTDDQADSIAVWNTFKTMLDKGEIDYEFIKKYNRLKKKK